MLQIVALDSRRHTRATTTPITHSRSYKYQADCVLSHPLRFMSGKYKSSLNRDPTLLFACYITFQFRSVKDEVYFIPLSLQRICRYGSSGRAK